MIFSHIHGDFPSNLRDRVSVASSTSILRDSPAVINIVLVTSRISKDKHLEHLELALGVVKSWGLPARTVGLRVNGDWTVEIFVP